MLTVAIGRSLPGVFSLAVLTLFLTLTLENLPDQLEQGRALSDWAIVYFVSYALRRALDELEDDLLR